MPANLIKNSSWEDDINIGWTYSLPVGGSASQNSTDPPLYVSPGTHSLCLTTPSTRLLMAYQDYTYYQSLIGRTVTYTGWVWANTASAARIAIEDGATAGYTTHPGDSTWRQLSLTLTLDPGATYLRILAEVVSQYGYFDNFEAWVSDTGPKFSIAFSTSPFVAFPNYVDLSDQLMNFSIRRGRQWELNRMEAGTATVQLKNISGDFWPNNTTGAYYDNIKPWKKCNIGYVYNSTWYDLYTGYIESWNPDFVMKPIKAPVMNLNCADAIKGISQLLLNDAAGYGSELSGARVNNVLDDMGWNTTERSIDTGQSTLQATGSTENVNAMSHLYTVQDTDLGILFETPSGSIKFQDRHARLKAPYTTSQATFGDSAGEMGYSEIDLGYEDIKIFNDVRVTRLSGTEQTASSTTSQDAYGKRGLQKTSLLMASDADALAQAQYLLGRYKNPVMRVKQVKILPNADPTNLFPKALGYDLSTRITMKLAQASLNDDYHIEGIRHEWNIQDAKGLKTTWMLTNATWQATWILDDVTYSVLDSTTIPSY